VPEIVCGDEDKRMSLAFFYFTAFTSMSVSSWLGRPWVARMMSRLFIGTEKKGRKGTAGEKLGGYLYLTPTVLDDFHWSMAMPTYKPPGAEVMALLKISPCCI
jgi:hypothetical protein